MLHTRNSSFPCCTTSSNGVILHNYHTQLLTGPPNLYIIQLPHLSSNYSLHWNPCSLHHPLPTNQLTNQPTTNWPPQPFHHLLSHRFKLLKTGDLQQLYLTTRTSHHTGRPSSPILIPTFDDLGHNREAQFATNQDNLHTAFNRIKSVTPKVTLTPHYLHILCKLYQPRLPFHPPDLCNTQSQHITPATAQSLTYLQLLHTLQKQKRGTTPGPFADSIDLFCDYATHKTHQHQTHTHT
jgi:hypothetical protein